MWRPCPPATSYQTMDFSLLTLIWMKSRTPMTHATDLLRMTRMNVSVTYTNSPFVRQPARNYKFAHGGANISIFLDTEPYRRSVRYVETASRTPKSGRWAGVFFFYNPYKCGCLIEITFALTMFIKPHRKTHHIKMTNRQCNNIH